MNYREKTISVADLVGADSWHFDEELRLGDQAGYSSLSRSRER